jgi:hypothetical protein
LTILFAVDIVEGEEMETAMQLEKEHLEKIGQYVKSHFSEWLKESMPRYSRDYEVDLRERVIRVEEELKSQREIIIRGFDLIEKRFEQVDKRFEQNDKRFGEERGYMEKRFEDQRELMKFGFEQMNKRFSQLMWMIGILATAVVSVVVAVMKG